MANVLDLFPDSAAVDRRGLVVGGLPATELAQEHGTPLVVFCEQTLRAAARAYRAAAPDALVVYGTKAFPNVALLRLFAEEGLGRRRLDARRARLRAPGRARRRAPGRPRQQQERRGARGRGGRRRARRPRRARRGGARRDGRRPARARPRHARDRGAHARGDPHRPARLEVRAAAGRGARGARPRAPSKASSRAGCTSTSARS